MFHVWLLILINILIWGFGGRCMFLTGVRILDLHFIWSMDFDTPMFQNFSLSWFWRREEHQYPLSPLLGLWGRLEVPDWGLASQSWFWYGHFSLIYPCSKIWLSILILVVQRTSMSFEFWYGALEDAGGSWLGFGISILIWIWPLVFDIPMIQILALYLDFEGAKNIHVLKVLIWGFGGRWRFLTGVWNLDIDLDMVPGF